MGVHDHKHHAETVGEIRCLVLAVSDTRTEETDESGKLAVEFLRQEGKNSVTKEIIPNDEDILEKKIGEFLKGPWDFLLTIGGTGIGKRDISVDIVEAFLEKKLDGFGECFRSASMREIGTAAIMSRATLGVSEGKLLASIPGSAAAVKIAIGEILVKELNHLIWELRK